MLVEKFMIQYFLISSSDKRYAITYKNRVEATYRSSAITIIKSGLNKSNVVVLFFILELK
jgi:hypothetical protein